MADAAELVRSTLEIPIIATALTNLARGEAGGLDAYVVAVEQEIAIENTKTIAHCYFVQFDGNGFPRTSDFIQRICEHVIDYAIPRSEIEAAAAERTKTGSSFKWSRLNREARDLFVDLEKTGEGGELILFLFAEYIFSLPQIICKMRLKTSDAVHYHGADGIHASVDANTGLLSLHWGEAKMHETVDGAISSCLHSLAPLLLGGATGKPKRDLQLLRSYVDLDDPKIEEAIKAYLDPDNPKFNHLKYCGLAFVGFNSETYPADNQKGAADEISKKVQKAFSDWQSTIGRRVVAEKIDAFEINFVCMPFNSVEAFRRRFLQELGLAHAES